MDANTPIPYEQAQKLAQAISEQHHINSYKDWLQLLGRCLRDIPSFDFDYPSFEKAREYARKQKIKTIDEWVKIAEELAYANRNGDLEKFNIPSSPAKHYKNEWISWGDFFGTDESVPSKFLSYKDARFFVQHLTPQIKNCKEWDAYCKSGKKPKNIPHSPQKIYKEHGWIGWDCWFGTGLYGIGISDCEVQSQIDFEIGHIEEQMENVRYSYDTDEELMEAIEQEAIDTIDAVKRYIEAHPRDKDEE